MGKLKKDGFLEMTAHHTVCIMLYTMNVLTNRLSSVVGLAFCCSITDVFMALTRLIAETKYSKIGAFVGVALLIPVWFYFRLVAFPFNLYFIFQKIYGINDKLEKPNTLDNIYFILLGMIFILSIYWFYLIMISICKFLKKGIL